MDERDWIRRIVAGDTQSFSCLVAKYEKMAYTIALRIVENREDAEEVVQDAFLKMYRGSTALSIALPSTLCAVGTSLKITKKWVRQTSVWRSRRRRLASWIAKTERRLSRR